MNKKPLIGIIVNKPKPMPLYEMSKGLMVNLVIFNAKGIKWDEKKIYGFVFENGHWLKKICPFPSAIYNRLYNSEKTMFEKLEKVTGKGKVFNCITRFDKWEIDNILRKSSIRKYLPDTFIYDQSNILRLLHKYEKLIIKPSIGYLGREVYRIERRENNEYHLYHNIPFPKIKTTNEEEFIKRVNSLLEEKRFIVQQFIPFDQIDEKIYDIRIYVHKNDKGHWSLSGGFSRVSFVDSYIVNMSSELKSINEIVNGNNQLSVPDLQKMYAISLNVAKAVERKIGHLGELCVDFALHQKRPWIIEVNGKTQKCIVNRVNDNRLIKDIYSKPIQYAAFLSGKSVEQK